jgi:hypothetical protein
MAGRGIDRRSVVLAGLAMPALISASASSIAAAKFADNYRDFDGGGVWPPLPMVGGNRAPKESEEQTAQRILRATPRSSPLAVMHHLEHVTKRNKDGEAYNAGWQYRWNPVIVSFFDETSTKPEGDTTSWCAASLNWTLARAGYHGGTGNALSGSFREAPGKTHRPRPGDIVVFGNIDPKTNDFVEGFGHVGLFLAQRRDAVLVLGGNQTNATGHHAVCRKWLAKDGDGRRLHSFHAIRAFRYKAA